MHSPPKRRENLVVASAAVAALLAATAVAILVPAWPKWNVLPLLAIAALAIVSDLTSVEAGAGKIRVSGTLLGVMLAAVLLGGAPAAVVGVAAVGFGWMRSREPSTVLLANFSIYAWFPLVSGLFFHAAAHLFHVGQNDAGYFFLVLPTFAVGMVLNFLGIAAYDCYLRRSPIAQKIREGFLPVLAAELFSAVLITASVYFVVKTGTIGIAVLAAVLAIFQYLVGELLTSQQRAEELRRKATTDELTGLSNREHFSTVIADTICDSRLTREPFAVMLIDLDHFKEINDTLGHHYGDVILKDLGPRLAAHVGPRGTVARLGGDEFAVLPADRTSDPDLLGQIAQGLIECVQQPVAVDELTLDVGASIGVCRFPEDGEDVHGLLRGADVAMYAAKDDHTGYKLYEARLDRHSVRRLTVLSDFRRALDSDEFVLHYQPVVDIGRARPRGAEGLVRWQHPDLGLLPPGDFIPIAEQSGLIAPLTRYVLERAAAECKSWRDAGRDLSVSVNLTVRDLMDRQLPDQVSHVLDAHHLPADALNLEITESMIMSDPERALATVTRLRELGVSISVDDFGTGYSSLSNLKQLPVNELKIDRSFISSMLHDESDLIIVRSTINLGHDLRLKVVAEGVEDDLTLRRLGHLGCDLAQGYHLSRPLPGPEFLEWLDGVPGVPAAPSTAPVTRAASA